MDGTPARSTALLLMGAMVVGTLSPINAMAGDQLVEDGVLVKITSEVFEAPGSPDQLATRAQQCMAKLLTNHGVQISDNAGGTGVLGSLSSTLSGVPSASRGGDSSAVAGGDLFVSVDIPGGLVVANSRVDYDRMMMGHTAQSTVTFEARENRFRISHTNLGHAQHSSGAMRNNGFGKIFTSWGAGSKDAAKAFESVTSRVAACVLSGPSAGEAW